MIIEDFIFSFFWVCMGLSGTSIIARQLIREKLFYRVLKKRSFTLDNSWYAITSNGIGTAFRMKFVWGKISREMMKDAELRNLIVGARAASIGLFLGSGGVLLSMLWWSSR